MLTAGTTIISTLVTPRVEDSSKCEDHPVLKMMIMPIIDTRSMMVHHQRADGLWEDASGGDLRHFSLTGFFSGFARLDGEEARMVGRSCLVFKGIQISQSDDKNFLHEKFIVTVEEPQIFKTSCCNGSAVAER